MCLYIYTSATFLYARLNAASREGNRDKIPTLGPYAKVLNEIVIGAGQYRKDIDVKKYSKCTLYRGSGLTLPEIQDYRDKIGKTH